MKNLLDISKYKLLIIGLYVFIFPLFFIFTPNVLNYNFSTIYLEKVLSIIVSTFLGSYLLHIFFHFRKIKWQKLKFSQIILIFIYALLFAIPEEIIFRGIIQNFLQNYLDNIVVAIIISSGIFGLAHLPNGGKGLHPKDWNWRFAVVTFLAGLPLSVIFAITGSLLIPTLLHAFFLIFFKLFTEEVTN
jgi:membrane protease YdiL (CAAX protease family)